MITTTIKGTGYALDTIKAGVGRKLKAKFPDESDFNVAFIAESLKAGGFAEATPEWVDENLGYFDGELTAVLLQAFEANGLKVEKPKTGEEQPPAEAAA